MANKLRGDNEHLINSLNSFDTNKVAEFQTLKVNMDQASLY